MSICEWTTFERMSRPSTTTAAEVSSQDDSMPRIFTGSILLGFRLFLEDARLDLRLPLLDLGLEDLDAGLQLEVLEALGAGRLLALHDALVAPGLHQLGVLVLGHLHRVVRNDAPLLLPLLAVHARPVRRVVARGRDLEVGAVGQRVRRLHGPL